MPHVPPARHLLRAKDLADARYAEPLDVEDLARAAGLSKAHFSREFRRAFGDSPHAYLLTRRLERAAGPAEHRLLHDELQARVRRFADRLSGRPPVGGKSGSGTRMRRPRLRSPATPHVSRRQRAGPDLASAHSSSRAKETKMIRISNAQLWVHDQEEALAFYTEKVGMEVRADVTLPEMDGFRWLTVGPPGQEDVSIVLMAIPGPPVMDEETTEQVRTLMAKGFAGTVFLTTDDCHASYEELRSRG